MADSTDKITFTIATKVTIARIVLIPLFVIVLMTPWPSVFDSPKVELIQPLVALLTFIFISATDAVDGHLARSRNEVTALGKFLDPLADKILVAAALLALIELGSLPAWIALIILARDFIISGLRMLAAAEGIVIAASWQGKAKTVFQIIAISFFIIMETPLLAWLSQNVWSPLSSIITILGWIVMSIALILTITSMIEYIMKSSDVLKGSGTSDKKLIKANNLDALAADVIAYCKENNIKIAAAESCTAGMVGSAIASVPGASDFFNGSAVTYSNDAKSALLGVSEATLAEFSAVSEETAKEMAEGAKRVYCADRAVSTTGYAGPGGGTEKAPVGTVCFALATEQGTETFTQFFKGDRAQIREQASEFALRLLADLK